MKKHILRVEIVSNFDIGIWDVIQQIRTATEGLDAIYLVSIDHLETEALDD